MRACIIFLVVLLTAVRLNAQNEITLEDLQTPNSPGFILLDVAPTSIERPANVKAFTASMLNALNSGGSFAKNYAAEFAPFWFVKSRNISPLKYWGIKSSGTKAGDNLWFSALKLGTISFAFINKDSASDITSSNFSIGGRTTLLRYTKSTHRLAIKNANDAIVNQLARITAHFNRIVSDPMQAAQAIADSVSADPDIISSEERIAELLTEKPKFALDFAYAGNWSFAEGAFSNHDFNRSGAWLTLNWSNKVNEGNYITLYGVARWLYDRKILNSEIVSTNSMDWGARLEFQLNNLSLSYEWLQRRNNDLATKTVRSSGYLRYKISDDLYLTSALGRNFGDTNNLISQFGILYGGGKQSVTPQQ